MTYPTEKISSEVCSRIARQRVWLTSSTFSRRRGSSGTHTVNPSCGPWRVARHIRLRTKYASTDWTRDVEAIYIAHGLVRLVSSFFCNRHSLIRPAFPFAMPTLPVQYTAEVLKSLPLTRLHLCVRR